MSGGHGIDDRGGRDGYGKDVDGKDFFFSEFSFVVSVLFFKF